MSDSLVGYYTEVTGVVPGYYALGWGRYLMGCSLLAGFAFMRFCCSEVSVMLHVLVQLFSMLEKEQGGVKKVVLVFFVSEIS